MLIINLCGGDNFQIYDFCNGKYYSIFIDEWDIQDFNPTLLSDFESEYVDEYFTSDLSALVPDFYEKYPDEELIYKGGYFNIEEIPQRFPEYFI